MSRVCLFAQFDPHHRIRGHVINYVGHLQRCGFQTFVACSGSRLPPREDRDALRDTGAKLMFRPNHGLDFGAWQYLIREGHAEGAEAVLLANDSVFGPFSDLTPIIRRMNGKGYDVWGMIESMQHTWHLQSWFLHFTAEAFAAPAVQEVFAQPFAALSKARIIADGELALGDALRRAGLRCGAVVGRRQASWVARRQPLNPMHIDWRYNLVSGGLPFLKADLLRTNMMNIPWAREWQTVLRQLKQPTDAIDDYLFDYTGTRPDDAGAHYEVPVRPLAPAMLAYYALASRDHVPATRALFRGIKAFLTNREAYYGKRA